MIRCSRALKATIVLNFPSLLVAAVQSMPGLRSLVGTPITLVLFLWNLGALFMKLSSGIGAALTMGWGIDFWAFFWFLSSFWKPLVRPSQNFFIYTSSSDGSLPLRHWEWQNFLSCDFSSPPAGWVSKLALLQDVCRLMLLSASGGQVFYFWNYPQAMELLHW